MKKFFENVGEVSVEKLTENEIGEAADFIYSVYQHEKIWIDYSKEEISQEIISSFKNICYRPVFFIALLDEKIIGIASYMESHMSSQAFELSFGTILPQYQRKGIGRWLTYIRLKEIVSIDKNAVIFTRARRPNLFEKFNFKSIYETRDQGGSGMFHYMYCPAGELNLDI